ANTRHLLQRRSSDVEDGSVGEAVEAIQLLLRKLPRAETVDEVRGYEGHGAALLFGLYGRLIRAPGFTFTTRVRRPPTDAVNAMLSFGFTLLFQNVRAMLHLQRLNPYLGHLHVGHDYRPALGSDLMEEFRTLIE